LFSIFNKQSKVPIALFITVIIISILAVFVMSENITNLTARSGAVGDIRNEDNVFARSDELVKLFQQMDIGQYITGVGVGHDYSVRTVTGDLTSILHIGVFNIWWRFGGVIFCYSIFILLRLIFSWFRSLRLLRKNKISTIDINQAIAYVSCAPGFFTLAILSFMSGGWAISAFLTLGILWGIFLKLKSGELMVAYNDEDGNN
jgi:hypothetical protein